MKKTLLILGIALTSLTSCEKSPTFEECRVGTVQLTYSDFDYENPDLSKPNWVVVVVRNNCSGNNKELRFNSNMTVEVEPYYTYKQAYINGDTLTLDKPW